MALMEHVSPSRVVPNLLSHVPTGLLRQPRHRALAAREPRAHPDAQRLPRLRAQARAAPLHLGLRPRHRRARRVRRRRDQRRHASPRPCRPRRRCRSSTSPARINGVDYVDGGVRHTANIDVAIEQGADLIICYNPFRPVPEPGRRRRGRRALLRRRPLPLGPRPLRGAEPGVPHAAPLAAAARPPALPGRRPLPGRHRAARAPRAGRRLLRHQPARVLGAAPTPSATASSRCAPPSSRTTSSSARCSAATASSSTASAARRKAEKLRSSRGWKVTEPSPSEARSRRRAPAPASAWCAPRAFVRAGLSPPGRCVTASPCLPRSRTCRSPPARCAR